MSIQSKRFVRTGEVYSGLIAALQSVSWTRDAVNAPAFDEVRAYDIENLQVALREIVGLKSRICLVVFVGERFENTIKGQLQTTTLYRQFGLVIADRNYGDRAKSLLGDESQPGAYLLGDLVAESLRGPLATVPGAVVQIDSVEPMGWTGEERSELYTRGAKLMHLEVLCGHMQSDLGRSYF